MAKKESRNAFLLKQAVGLSGFFHAEDFPSARYFMCMNPMARQTALLESLNIRPLVAPGAMNGYLLFDKRARIIDSRAKNLLDAIPVHGGITYNTKDSVGRCFGFDTAHYNSRDVRSDEPEWVKGECFLMYESLRVIRAVQQTFIQATSQYERAKIYEEVAGGMGYGTILLLRAMSGGL